MLATPIQRCFTAWHDANAHRFLVPVRRGERTPRSLRLDFPSLGLKDTLYAALRDSEITFYAFVEGECWDLLISLDEVWPKPVEGGCCVRGPPYTGHVQSSTPALKTYGATTCSTSFSVGCTGS
jgi:hypothetical protein